MRSLGLDRLVDLGGPRVADVRGAYGRMAETSAGKDSVTGHWEMTGIVLDRAFPTYPHGFPADLITEFERRIGRRTLGNVVASGTVIIDQLGPEHLRTGSPIVYTSADSVFQIAAHEDVIPIDEQYRTMPEVPDPLDCPSRGELVEDTGSIMTRFDMRLALGTPWDRFDGTSRAVDGRSGLWVRMPDVDVSAAAIAILGDYVPFGISQSQGNWIPSNSLDNTIRVQRLVPTEWVLCDVRIDGIHDGFGHGSVYLWSADGTLLATASQSAVLHNPRT